MSTQTMQKNLSSSNQEQTKKELDFDIWNLSAHQEGIPAYVPEEELMEVPKPLPKEEPTPQEEPEKEPQPEEVPEEEP